MATKDQVLELRTRCPELTNNEIAERLGCNPSYVRATFQRAAGYKPPTKVAIGPEERAEREQDQRDLDMLSDIRDGHSIRDTAKHWGVPYTYLQLLAKAAKEAA